MTEEKGNEMIHAITEIAKGHSKIYKKGLQKLSENLFQNGMSPKDAVGISDQTAERIYAQAYQLYNLGKFDDARKLFSSLVLMDFTQAKYMLGLAACYHVMKEYDQAAQNYLKCAALDPKSPIPYYHAYDCFMQMEDVSSAMVALNLTIKRCGEKVEYLEMKNKASLYLEGLKEQVKKGQIQPKKEG